MIVGLAKPVVEDDSWIPGGLVHRVSRLRRRVLLFDGLDQSLDDGVLRGRGATENCGQCRAHGRAMIGNIAVGAGARNSTVGEELGELIDR